MDLEEPILQGYLLLPSQSKLEKITSFTKSWHKKYCKIFKASKYGIQRVEIFENQDETVAHRIITLESCIKISLSSQPLTFSLLSKSGFHPFSCCTDHEMATWMNAFQSVAFKDDSTSVTVEEENDLYCTSGEGVFTVRISETEASRNCGLEILKNYTLVVGATEMKLLDTTSQTLYTWPYQYIRKYGYSEKKFTFEAGRRCGSGEGSFCLEHKYGLEIYRCFVANKKKMKQMLNNSNQNNNNNNNNNNSNNNNSCDNSPTVDCSDAQFHAALSMEAGSRSPLPPSSNTSKNLIDLDMSNFPPKPLQSPMSPTESPLGVMCNKPKPVEPPVVKTKPIPPAKPKQPPKPPRKPNFTPIKPSFEPDQQQQLDPSLSIGSSVTSLFSARTINPPKTLEIPKGGLIVVSDSVSEKPEKKCEVDNVDKHPYDLVEVRNDAWRTHGLDRVPHTERLKQQQPPSLNASSKQSLLSSEKDVSDNMSSISNGSHYEKLSFSPNSSQNSIKSSSSSIIHNIPSPNDLPPDYDRLQHFGYTYKNKSGMRGPASTASSMSLQQISSQDSLNTTGSISATNSNDYDFVESLKSVRMADDSHHGYGFIRKKSNLVSPGNSTIDTEFKINNDTEYAIVSKPKRV